MYMGIDVGTSAVKAAVVDEAGIVVDLASAPLAVSRPRPLWSEQNPADWWSATNSAVSDLRLPLRNAVRAIGLSGQMHGATLLDKQYRALRPAILWNDGRSARQCAELEAGVPDMMQITGNRAMPEYFHGLVQPTDAERVLNGYRLKQRRPLDWKEQCRCA
jgi:xylulokinase